MNASSMTGPRAAAAVLGLTLIIAAGGFAAWGWRRASAVRAQPLSMAGTPVKSTAFIGTRSCRECHPGEYAAFVRSGHANTLTPAGATEIARKVDGRTFPDTEDPGVNWSYRRDGRTLIATREEGSEHVQAVLDYALGSGSHAVTFISLFPSKDGSAPPSGEEHRMSYFAHSDTMAMTPGHIRRMNEPGRTPTGLHLEPPGVLDCIECHGTRTAPPFKKGLAPETMIPNISCERCHGPGRAHAEAARAIEAGRDVAAVTMPFHGEDTGPDQINLCGRCHRTPSMIPTSSIRTDSAILARFPSVGLSFSACFTKSEGALSCTTCHDPHGRVSRDVAAYEAACLVCHDAGVAAETREKLSAAAVGAPCPVNPSDGCIKCHMPLREPSDAGLRFTDHWIRKPDRPASDSAAAR